jgi:hypothetical protein
MLGTEIRAEIMVEPQPQRLELDELGPASCTTESQGDGQTDPKLEIEEANRGRASDQRRVHKDPLVTSAESPGADIKFEGGWTADGGRPDRLREPRDDDVDEYDTGTLDIRRSARNHPPSLLSPKGPVKEARRSPSRIETDSSEKPHINLCQVRCIL